MRLPLFFSVKITTQCPCRPSTIHNMLILQTKLHLIIISDRHSDENKGRNQLPECYFAGNRVKGECKIASDKMCVEEARYLLVK